MRKRKLKTFQIFEIVKRTKAGKGIELKVMKFKKVALERSYYMYRLPPVFAKKIGKIAWKRYGSL